MKPTRVVVAALVALVVLVATACGSSDQSVPNDSVAVVDGVPVTKADLEGLLARAKATYKTQKRAFPKAGTTEFQSPNGSTVFVGQSVKSGSGASNPMTLCGEPLPSGP